MNSQCQDTRAYNTNCSKLQIKKDHKIVKSVSSVMESPST